MLRYCRSALKVRVVHKEHTAVSEERSGAEREKLATAAEMKQLSQHLARANSPSHQR